MHMLFSIASIGGLAIQQHAHRKLVLEVRTAMMMVDSSAKIWIICDAQFFSRAVFDAQVNGLLRCMSR